MRSGNPAIVDALAHAYLILETERGRHHGGPAAKPATRLYFFASFLAGSFFASSFLAGSAFLAASPPAAAAGAPTAPAAAGAAAAPSAAATAVGSGSSARGA